jgi:hypothetical protein
MIPRTSSHRRQHILSNSTSKTDASNRARAAKVGDKRSDAADTSRSERDAGDQVNRFLLCTLVSESSKRIKASAERAGESMPLAMIVRGVLRAYRVAAARKTGRWRGRSWMSPVSPELNDKVLKERSHATPERELRIVRPGSLALNGLAMTPESRPRRASWSSPSGA